MSNIRIIIGDSFERESKRLIKRYKSLKGELAELINSLQNDPFQGADLGGGVHKIRLAVASKGKGKRASARVISHVDVVLGLMEGEVTLLSIYDKSEQSTIASKRIRQLLKEAGI